MAYNPNISWSYLRLAEHSLSSFELIVRFYMVHPLRVSLLAGFSLRVAMFPWAPVRYEVGPSYICIHKVGFYNHHII